MTGTRAEQLAPGGFAVTRSLRCMESWVLLVLLVASEVIYLALLRLDAVNGVRAVLTFLALFAALFALYATAYLVVRKMRDHPRGALLIVTAGAVLFRLTLLPAGLPHRAPWGELLALLKGDVRGESVAYERFQLYDDDIWRYLWDGHIWAHGVNPYLYVPIDPALDGLAEEENAKLTDGRSMWAEIRDNINYEETLTIYPPLAQAVFRFSHRIAPGSVLVMKALLVGFDLLAALLIALTLGALGRPRTQVLLYAWNPLVIKVVAASGHVDAVLVAALAATAYFVVRRSKTAAAATFGLAILIKISPLVLLPLLVRRIGWRNAALAGAVVLGGYTPFLGAGRAVFGGFLTFARGWQFNAGPFALFQWLAGLFSADPASVARAIAGLTLILVVCWLAWRDDASNTTFAKYGATALGALVVLSPTVMPWYVTWVLPLSLIANQRVWAYFSALVCLAFLVMIDEQEHAWALWLEYGVFAGLLWQEFCARSRPQPQAPRVIRGDCFARGFGEER